MATLKDVAALAGVTVTTVSRVLNNRGYISEQTRGKVYDAMKELHYQPNELARSLTKRRTNIIGVIVPSIAHPYFSKVADTLERCAAANGYKILLCNSNHQREKEIEYLAMLESNKVAGIVLCSRAADIEEHLRRDLPLVAYERGVSSQVSSVSCDNYQGGELASERLVASGCRHLLHIGGSAGVHMPADQRCEAFSAVCKRHGVEGRVFHTQEAQFQAMDYAAFIRKLLEENPQTDGVFASSDVIAAQVLQACAALGRRVPEDVQVIGFDDVELASLTFPRITTIRQPIKEMCTFAIDNIVQQLEKGGPIAKTVFSVSLVERETTRRMRNEGV